MNAMYKLLPKNVWEQLSILKILIGVRPVTVFISDFTVDIMMDTLSIYMITVENQLELEEIMELFPKIFTIEEIVI